MCNTAYVQICVDCIKEICSKEKKKKKASWKKDILAVTWILELKLLFLKIK